MNIAMMIFGFVMGCSTPHPPCEEAAIQIPAAQKGGEAEVVQPEHMVLMLDYSGSMCPGWQESPPVKPSAAECEPCSNGPGSKCLGDWYYNSPDFSRHVAEMVDAATPSESMKLDIVLFNQHLWHVNGVGELTDFGELPDAVTSPSLDIRGKLNKGLDVGTASNRDIASWIHNIPEPSMARGYKETRMEGALEAVLGGINQETIIWLVTDNILDSSQSPEAQRAKRFYTALKQDPRIKGLVAYPIHEAESCSWMCGTSMIAYGIYVSPKDDLSDAQFRAVMGQAPETAAPLDGGLLWNPKLQELSQKSQCEQLGAADISGKPIRFKPVERDTLNVQVGEVACQNIVYGDPYIICQFDVSVKNTLHHQVVDRALVRLHAQQLYPYERSGDSLVKTGWAPEVCPAHPGGQDADISFGKIEGGEFVVEPTIRIENLQPQGELNQRVSVLIRNKDPRPQNASELWKLAMASAYYLIGDVVAEVTDIHTTLEVKQEQLECIYGTAALPGVIQEGSQVDPSYGSARLTIQIQNSWGWLTLMILALVVLGVAILVGVGMLQQKVYFRIIEQRQGHTLQSHKLQLARFRSLSLNLSNGVRLKMKRGWGDIDYPIPEGTFGIKEKMSTSTGFRCIIFDTSNPTNNLGIEMKNGH